MQQDKRVNQSQSQYTFRLFPNGLILTVSNPFLKYFFNKSTLVHIVRPSWTFILLFINRSPSLGLHTNVNRTSGICGNVKFD